MHLLLKLVERVRVEQVQAREQQQVLLEYFIKYYIGTSGNICQYNQYGDVWNLGLCFRNS